MASPLDPVLDRISMSPLGKLLGFELVEWAPERVVIKMPFRDDICTVGDLVHGGAISALADTTATAVAWSGVDAGNPPQRGTTISLSVDFMLGARGRDLLAEGTIARRVAAASRDENDEPLTTPGLRYHPTFRERGIHGVPPPVLRGACTTSAPPLAPDNRS